MDTDKDTLLYSISMESKEIGDIFKENGITEDADIQALCYEALSELYPGGGMKIVKRSKVWKLIQASAKGDKVKRSYSPSSSTPSTPLSMRPSISSPIQDDNDDITFPGIQWSPVLKSCTRKPSNTVSSAALSLPHSIHPQYIIYSDPSVQAALLKDSMDKKMIDRLVRGTIHNMVSASSIAPFNRFPTIKEIEEMAKSLIITYPCLKDDETSHGVLFNALKRRLGNTKPVAKPQGPCQKKRKYAVPLQENGPGHAGLGIVRISIGSSDQKEDDMEDGADDDCPTGIAKKSDVDGSDVDGSDVMDRHYKCLSREMEKKKPNVLVINTYLNKQFVARREWIQNVNAEERVEKLLEAYPCFKDHIEVIEEARRVLLVASSGDREDFKSCLLQKLNDELEALIYFGMHSKGLIPPKSYKKDYKILYVFQNLGSIFGTKQKVSKKPMELLHRLKVHEDVDTWCMKRNGNVPTLLMDDDKCYLVLGRSILCQIDVAELMEAVLALLSSFYLLDYDYPKEQEIGLSILQYYVFNDTNVPEDIVVSFQTALTTYKNFRN